MAYHQNTVKLTSDQALLNNIQEYLPDLEITLLDLKNPTHNAVCNFYTAFLEELGANAANVVQIQMNQMTLITHADMYNATIPIFNLYHAVKYFLSSVGVQDFSLSDLVNPVPKRTQQHFNALMHFLCYCDETISGLQPQLQEISKLRVERDELCAKIESVTSEINKRATNRARRKERFRELEKLTEKEKEKRDVIVAEKKSLEQVLENVKKEVMQYEEKETQLIRIVKNMENENEKLDSMIVKSPEKLKTDLEQLEKKKEKCAEIVSSLKSQFEDKERLSDIHIKENEKQKIRFETLNKLLDINKRLSEKRIKNELLEKNYLKMMEKEEELNNKIESEQLKLKTFTDSVEEWKTRKEQKDAESVEILRSTEEEYKNLVKRRKEKTQLRDRIQMLINERTEDLERIQSDLLELAASCLKFHEKLVEKENEFKTEYNIAVEKLQSEHSA